VTPENFYRDCSCIEDPRSQSRIVLYSSLFLFLNTDQCFRSIYEFAEDKCQTIVFGSTSEHKDDCIKGSDRVEFIQCLESHGHKRLYKIWCLEYVMEKAFQKLPAHAKGFRRIYVNPGQP
jgi:hypothetical protein